MRIVLRSLLVYDNGDSGCEGALMYVPSLRRFYFFAGLCWYGAFLWCYCVV